jgi:hypothetical protein
VRDAVALWEEHQALRVTPERNHTPAEAAARIRELREGNILPEGGT